MSSKASRKRAKRRNQITLPGGVVITAPPIQGQRSAEPPADVVGLTARCRRAGIPATTENMRDAKSQLWGCNAGQAIIGNITPPDERAMLWGAVQHIRRVYVTYASAIGAPSRYPKCLSILLPVDEMHATADSPAADLRTEEERYHGAITAWTKLHGWLELDKPALGPTIRTVVDDHASRDWPAIKRGLDLVLVGLGHARP